MTENGNNLVMPVSPMPYGNGYGAGNTFGGDGAWWLLVLLFALGNNGGWGNGANGGGGVYPYLLNTQTQNDVNRGFADANLAASIAGINSNLVDIMMGLQNCCCENRASIADLKYTVATENCADRYEAAQNTRDIIENANKNNQAILDKLCQLELDGYKRENDSLRSQLNMATINNGLNAEVDALYNRLKNCPVPSMPVYGMTPIFTCANGGCGCGGNGSF